MFGYLLVFGLLPAAVVWHLLPRRQSLWDTVPEKSALAALDLICFDNVSACGTATAVSLPCMFSNLPHVDYSKTAARSRKGLLDVAAAGR